MAYHKFYQHDRATTTKWQDNLDPAKPVRQVNNAVKRVLMVKATRLLAQRFGLHHPFRVMDLGCGRGGDIAKFQDMNVGFYVGVDADIDALNEAKQRMNKARKKYAVRVTYDFKHLAFREHEAVVRAGGRNSLHLVWCQFALHYAADRYDTLDHLLQAVRTVLKTDGVLVVTLLDPQRQRLPWSNSLCRVEPFGSDDAPTVRFSLGAIVRDQVEPLLGGLELYYLAQRHRLRLDYEIPLPQVIPTGGDDTNPYWSEAVRAADAVLRSSREYYDVVNLYTAYVFTAV